jgi:hypothetical protein
VEIPSTSKWRRSLFLEPSFAMEVPQDLFRWAKDKGVELNGIKPQRIPGRGIGIIATRRLKVMGPITIAALSDSESRREKRFSQYPPRLSAAWTQSPTASLGNSLRTFPSMASWPRIWHGTRRSSSQPGTRCSLRGPISRPVRRLCGLKSCRSSFPGQPRTY